MPRGGKRNGAGRKMGSKNKNGQELRELARLWGEPMLLALVDLAENSNSESVRLAAMKEVLDRGYGRPRPAADPEAGHQGSAKGLSDFYNDVEEAKSKMIARVEAIIRAKKAAE